MLLQSHSGANHSGSDSAEESGTKAVYVVFKKDCYIIAVYSHFGLPAHGPRLLCSTLR